MKVTVVGTSCTWFKRANTSFIIDDKILFDVPVGNYKRVINFVDIFKLDWIFISHLHDDHFSDLRVIATRHIRESEARNRTKKLKIYCPRGTAETIVAINKLIHASPDETSLEILKQHIDFIEIQDGMEFEENGYKIKVYQMQHGGVETYGLTFTDASGKTVAFSSDTIVCENLHKMLSISNFAFVDMASSTPSKTHIFTEDFVKLEKQYKKCKLFPIHTSDACQEFAKQNGMNFLEDGQIVDL